MQFHVQRAAFGAVRHRLDAFGAVVAQVESITISLPAATATVMPAPPPPPEGWQGRAFSPEEWRARELKRIEAAWAGAPRTSRWRDATPADLLQGHLGRCQWEPLHGDDLTGRVRFRVNWRRKVVVQVEYWEWFTSTLPSIRGMPALQPGLDDLGKRVGRWRDATRLDLIAAPAGHVA